MNCCVIQAWNMFSDTSNMLLINQINAGICIRKYLVNDVRLILTFFQDEVRLKPVTVLYMVDWVNDFVSRL